MLCSQSLNRFVDLIQIVVCGDQTLSKSSVVSAIIDMLSPVTEYTQFAVGLVLFQDPAVGVSVRIVPGRNWPEEEC
ncbi:hypothetical protein HD806DRAFT_486034 [Xylariaceae sp. AK1471]|nr:hypothetical protein HD806DRAFT_486034 [Xylariaceae sp. AK1471]